MKTFATLACLALLALISVGFNHRQAPLTSKVINARNFYSEAKTKRAFPNSVPEPVSITLVSAQGNAIAPSVAFLGGDDWLKDLKVVVKNNSTKTVTYVAVQLTFDVPGEKVSHIQELALGKSIFFAESYRDRIPALSMEPGDTGEITWQGQGFDAYARFVEYMIGPTINVALSRLNAVQIHPIYVGFSDDTAWSWGREMKRVDGEWQRVARADVRPSGARMLKASFKTSVPLCYDLIDPPNPRNASCTIANCPNPPNPAGSCFYSWVPIVGAEQGAKKKPTSPVCYKYTTGANCGCCQTGIDQLDLNQLCGFE